MTAPTVAVTVRLADFGGPARAGIKVTARLSDVDYTAAGVFVSTDPVTATTDASGVAVLNVFPNAVSPSGLGTAGTTVLFTASISGSRSLKVQAAVPNAACNLTDIQIDEVTGLTAAQLAVQQAQAAEVQTALDRIATAADRVQTGLDRAATAADRLQTGLDRTSTTTSAAASLASQNAAASSALTAGQALAAIGGTTAAKLTSAVGMNYRAGYQQRPKFELYVPTITSLAQLTSPTGLAIHASGVGVVAAVNGTNGTATIPLPTGASIDRTRPFIFAIKMEVNENTNDAKVQLCNATKDFWSGPRMVTFKQSAISVTAGTTALLNSISNGATDGAAGSIPAGTQFWFVVIGTGDKTVTLSIIPDIAQGALDATPIKRNPLFQGWYNRLNYNVDVLSNVSAGAGEFTYGDTSIVATLLSQVFLQNASSTSRIIGLYVCVDEIAGPADYQLGVPGFMVTNVNQEQSSVGSEQTLLLPRDYGGPRDIPLVMHMHANGNPGTLLQATGVAPQLFYAGYAQSATTGAQVVSDFSGATSSNWGAPTGLVYRRNLDEWYSKNAPLLGRRMALGLSMGGLNALRYQAEYGSLTAIVTISGAVDLTDSFNNRGFASIINAGYGAWYRCKVANTGNDPAGSPANWTPINSGVLAVSPRYMLAPQNWKSGTAWAVGTAYSVGDVVFKAYTGGIAGLSAYDPKLNPSQFTSVPIKMWHGDADVLIPIAQMTSFATAVNGAGGSVQTVTVAGGTHVGATMFDPAAIQAFFDQFRDL